MIEKTPTESMEDYSGYSTRQLTAQVLALYQQIERATLQNLQLARKNSQLEIQIETIDEVIRAQHNRTPVACHSTPLAQQGLTQLQEQQLELAERVARIEEMLRGQEGKQAKDSQNTLHKVTSITDLMRRQTLEKGKGKQLREAREEAVKREETARKGKYA